MPTVAMLFAQSLARAAGLALGADGRLMDGERCLLRAKVQGGKILASDHYAILSVIRERVPERAALCIRYARSLDVDRVGPVGLACKAAPRLGGSLQRLVRYYNLLSQSMRYELTPVEGGVRLSQDILVGGGPGRVFSPEAGLAVVYHLLLQIAAQPFVPRTVSFRHAAPVDAALFRGFYGCPAIFEGDHDGITFTDAALDTKNRVGDQGLSDFLSAHLDAELERLSRPISFADRVRTCVREELSEGTPTAARLAADLGVSERSFHRKLAAEGASFRALLDGARQAVALSLLKDDARSLAEIAFLAGFSEQSAFTRAFKRWEGITPAEFRQRTPL